MGPRKMDDIVLPQRKARALDQIMHKGKKAPLHTWEDEEGVASSKGGDGSKSYGKWILWIVVVIAMMVLIFSFSTLFEKATFSIVPKVLTGEISTSFTAQKSPAPENIVPFQIMTIESKKTQSIPATEVKQVERRASGKVIIYNDFSNQPQRLIKNTRFETAQGLLFRIHESITVPGQTGKGTSKTPGSTDAILYADEAGERYNISLSDFTIPGFKGTPRFNKFYARSKAPMAGGFTGSVKTVSESTLRKTQTDLQTSIKADLLAKARGQKPSNTVFYESGSFLTYDDASLPVLEDNKEKDTVEITEKGTLQAILFDKKKLEENVVKTLVTHTAQGELVAVKNLEDLTFSLNQRDQIAPLNIKTISFTLTGTPTLVWQTDIEKFKKAYVGQKKADSQKILANFPSIVRTEVTNRPFWKRSFPENKGDITVKILEP